MLNDVLKLDVHRDFNYKNISAKQYDKNSRTVTILFYDNDEVKNLEDNEVVRLRYTKPDGSCGVIDADADSQKDNTATFTLDPQMLDMVGKVKADVGIYTESDTDDYNDDKLISTYLFYINVEPSAYSEEAIMASENTSTLVNLIARQRILNKHTVVLNKRSKELITQMERMLTILDEIVPILEDKCKEDEGEKEDDEGEVDG